MGIEEDTERQRQYSLWLFCWQDARKARVSLPRWKLGWRLLKKVIIRARWRLLKRRLPKKEICSGRTGVRVWRIWGWANMNRQSGALTRRSMRRMRSRRTTERIFCIIRRRRCTGSRIMTGRLGCARKFWTLPRRGMRFI